VRFPPAPRRSRGRPVDFASVLSRSRRARASAIAAARADSVLARFNNWRQLRFFANVYALNDDGLRKDW